MRRLVAGATAVALLLSVTAAVPRAVTAIELGQWQHNPATGHFYARVSYLPWDKAEAFAVSVGGHLVTINDQAEQDWLAATFTEADLWIGMNDRDEEGTWVWSSGEPVTYTNWVSGEPNDWDAGEDAAVMNTTDGEGNLGWNDIPETFSQAGIVEVTQRPRGQVGAAPAGVNSFVGNFDIVAAGTSDVVAHVEASFREPTDDHLVPGSVAIYWAPGSHGAIRESHAQVLEAWFWDDVYPDVGYTQSGRVVGVLCDYSGPQVASCEPFAMVFSRAQAPVTHDLVGFSQPGSTECCGGDWFDVGRGSFNLRYVGDTLAPEGG